jgi:anti-sigma B factor antagonist
MAAVHKTKLTYTTAGRGAATSRQSSRPRPARADFEIHEAYDDRSVWLRLSGELDMGSSPSLKQRLADLRAEKRPVRIDLSGLEFMDSSGVHLLIGAFNAAREEGCQLTIDSALPPQVDRLFKLVALDRAAPGLWHDGPLAAGEDRQPPATTRLQRPFDRALELLELHCAAEDGGVHRPDRAGVRESPQ